MHDERSKECIIHEPIEQHELTDLHHGSLIFANKRDLRTSDLVATFNGNILNRNYSYYGHVQWVPL